MQLFTPAEYLKIDIASNYGMDKSTWNERIEWFDDNQNNLLQLLSQAKEPALYYAGVLAWEDTQSGKPSGYPISLDATASGFQLLAVLTGDSSAASLCNVTDTGYREDAYTRVYQAMLSKIGDTSKIDRDDVKAAVMTSLYGSEAIPKEVFGKGPLLNAFYETMQEVAPAAWELNTAFLEIWDTEAYSNDWVLPDNFHVKIKVMDTIVEKVHFMNQPFDVYRKVNQPMEKGRSLGANVIHSLDAMIVREMTRRCDYNPELIMRCMVALDDADIEVTEDSDSRLVSTLWSHYEKTGYLSARILNHIKRSNAALVSPNVVWNLIHSLPEKPFKVLSIHDCFRVLPSYGNDLRIQYNRQLTEIAQSSLLGNLFSQIMGREVVIGKLDPELHTKIMDTNYALS